MTTENAFAAVKASDENTDPVDLRMLVAIVQRRFWVFVAVAATIVAFALLYSLAQPNTYSATTALLLDRQKSQVTDLNSVLSDLPDDSASVDTEVQILRSPELLRRVVQRLDLTRDPELNGALAASSFTAKLRKLLLDSTEALGATKTNAQERVVANLASILDIERRGLTYVIGITANSLDAAKAARIANAVGEEYIARQIEIKRNATVEGQKFLQSRLSGLSTDVQNQESRAQKLRAQAGLPQTGTNNESYDQQVIQDTARQAIELQTQLAQRRGQLAAAQAARSNPGSLSAVLESNVVRDLKAQRSAILSRAADVSSRYGPLHPESRKVQEELRQIDEDISSEMGSIVASLSQDVRAAEQQLATINTLLAQLRRQSVTNARMAAEVQQVDRQAIASRGVYEDFLRRRRETSETEALIKPDASIISPATAPTEPSGPKRALLMAAGFGGAIALGLLAVVISELIDIKVSSASDVRGAMRIARVSSIPKAVAPAGPDSHPRLIIDNPLSSYTEAYRDLADLVMQGKAKRVLETSRNPVPLNPVPLASAVTSAHVLVVTSALPHEGKTTVSSSLALALAAANQRVLLIDADLRRPQVLSTLALPASNNAASVAEVLAGTASVDSVLVSYPDLPLSILPLSISGIESDTFRSGSFKALMDALRACFDCIIVDTAPVLAVSDARFLSLLADEVLVTIRWRKTSRFAARAAAQTLAQAQAPVTGVVLNAVDIKTQALYSRDDTLAFYSSYKSYYYPK